MVIFASPIIGLRGTQSFCPGILLSDHLERTEVMAWTKESREKYGSTYAEWSPDRQAHNLAWQKDRRAAKAIEEGRQPGKVGRPSVLTPEEKEAGRIRKNKKRTARSIAKRSEDRAAKAVAEGRVPGQVGQPRVLSDEERVANRAATSLKYRQANADEIRIRQAKAGRDKRATRALAEGRVPGVIGHLATFTEQELSAYLERWPREKDIYHARVQQQNSRAKKLGLPGVLTAMDIREIYVEQAGLCAFCARPFGDEIPEIDHWIAMNNGGSNNRDNIRLLHMGCNRTKGGKPLEAFGLFPLHQMLMDDPQPDDAPITQED